MAGGLGGGGGSSTQSCKVLVVDADTGRVVREGRAAHPEGTEVDPQAWESALLDAAESAGGLDDVAAVSVGGPQDGMVALDEDGRVVRRGLLWHDPPSGAAATELTHELGGAEAWAEAVGLVPVASFTVSKLRWLADAEPDNAARTTAVCLPHDWLTWRLAGAPGLDAVVTDRGDASGTGYWSAADDRYHPDLLRLALGHDAVVPRVLAPNESSLQAELGARLGAGTGDNAAAALGLGAGEGDVIVSIGTSGVATAVSGVPAADPSGIGAGFPDATGRYLPLVCTLNAARVLDATARLLGVDHATLSDLALSAPPGADGLVLVPYLEGERTPDRPTATGSLHGLTLATTDPAHLARAAVEGLLCGLADGLDALEAQGARPTRILLIGGGAASDAVRRIAPQVLGRPVLVPEPAEYVALGAARQAAWVLAQTQEPPDWQATRTASYGAAPGPAIRSRYAEAREQVLERT